MYTVPFDPISQENLLGLGRAGRYGSKFSSGEVTCIDAEDLPLLHSSLKSSSPLLELGSVEFALVGSIKPTNASIIASSTLFPLANRDYAAACRYRCPPLSIAAVAARRCSPLPLPLSLLLLSVSSFLEVSHLAYLLLSFVLQRAGLFPTFDLLSLYSRLHSRMGFHGILVPTSHNALKELESVHKVLDLYVWLSFRMEDSFPDRDVASSQKAICSLLIEEFLERLGWQRQAKGNYQHNSLLLQQRIQSSML
ncbi:hypothetical protein GW17_00031968 [Ensete ventricosum]|nr:hypothetical protein GW17_00031968 [Ensete ventricosum]